MADVSAEFLERVRALISEIDRLDYFQILRVPPDAPRSDIDASYGRQVTTYAPEQYDGVAPAGFADDLLRILGRVHEAYHVLKDDTKRERYRRQVESPERGAYLRWRDGAAPILVTPQARRLYARAASAWANGESDAAIDSLKMALNYEPDNASLKPLLEQWLSARRRRPT